MTLATGCQNHHVTAHPQSERLARTAASAKAAEARGDKAVANEEWRRYRLIRDGMRDPDELLKEGLELSAIAIELQKQ